MKILQINTVYQVGSTGKIATGIHDICEGQGIENITAYRYREQGKNIQDSIVISSWLDCHTHNRLARITGCTGCFSKIKTAQFLKWMEHYPPDVVHLHNLHGNYINLKSLFRYLKKKEIPVVWTLHDCWSFTGYCSHFDMIGCKKWKTGCNHCPQVREVSGNLVDNSKWMYRKKKEWFTGHPNMTLVTPSRWLADLAGESFLKDYPVKVIHNGIDLTVFKPTQSDFREKFGCVDKFVLLGVAFGWGERKGLDVFVDLAKRLSDDYQIVLVGTDERIDQQLPDNVISIHRTQNQHELAQIYSAADLFVNPTREENYPTVNMEAIACGTPALSFRTGGSPEIYDDSCGCTVDVDDIDSLEREICRIRRDKPYTVEACLKRAENFDMNLKFREYVELYEDCTHSTKRSV